MNICQKCKTTSEESRGWLISPMKKDPTKTIVRCPNCITRDALYKAGLNQRLALPQPNRVTITRHSKLGWEYTTGITQLEDGWTIEPPEKPYYTGTYLRVMDQIMHDRTFSVIKSGGTYYASSWFVMVNGMWRRIDVDSTYGSKPTDLAYFEDVTVNLVPLE